MENAIQGVTWRSTEWECGKEREIERGRDRDREGTDLCQLQLERQVKLRER